VKFVGKGQPLTRAGLNKALALLGLSVNDAAYIWTVVEVETAGLTQGFGFRVDRRPQILFERHMFRKYTNGRFDGVAPDISGPAGGYGLLSEQFNKWKKRSRFVPRRSSVPSGRLNRPHGAWVR
jgi:N-acetylmuramidase